MEDIDKLDVVNKVTEKFYQTKDEQWCTGTYVDESGRMCALGHLGVRHFQTNIRLAAELGTVIKESAVGETMSAKNKSIGVGGSIHEWIYCINDGSYIGIDDVVRNYTGIGPRSRMLRVLSIIRKEIRQKIEQRRMVDGLKDVRERLSDNSAESISTKRQVAGSSPVQRTHESQ